jgi:predicted MFS family arabinose efflux permease
VQARNEGVPTHYIGLILAAFAAGAILGAPLIPMLHRRVRPGWLLIGFVALVTAVLPLLAIPLGGFWMAGCVAVIGMAMPALQVLLQVLIFQQVPDSQRGRVVSAAMMLMSLGMPLGAALGGLLLQLFTPADAILCFAAVTGISTLFAVLQRPLRSAVWPQ